MTAVSDGSQGTKRRQAEEGDGGWFRNGDGNDGSDVEMEGN